MSGADRMCPEHGVPYPCPYSIRDHWLLEDRGDGWYVVKGEEAWGPWSEPEAANQLPKISARYATRLP